MEMFNAWTLVDPDAGGWVEWLMTNLGPGQFVGVDPLLVKATEFVKHRLDLTRAGLTLVAVDHNLIEQVSEMDVCLLLQFLLASSLG